MQKTISQAYSKPRHIGFLLGMTLIFCTALSNDSITRINTLENRIIYFNVIGSTFCICLLFRLRKSLVALNIIDMAFLTFIIFIAVNNFAVYGLYNNYLAALVLSAIIYFSARLQLGDLPEKLNVIENISLTFLAVSFAELSIALFQFFKIAVKHDSSYLLIGTFNNSGVLSIYIGSSFIYFLAVYLYINGTSRKQKLIKNLSGIYLLLVILILPSAQSRTAIISAALVSLPLLYQKYKPLERFPAKLKYGVVLAIVIITGLIAIKLYHFKQASADGRITIWRGTLEIVKQHPLTGVGFNQFQNKFPDYQAAYFKDHPVEGMTFADKNDYVFNDFLQLAAENGIPSLVLFIIVLLAVITKSVKSTKMPVYLIAALAGSLFLILSAMSSYPFQIISLWMNLVFFLLVISVLIADTNVIKLARYQKLVIFLIGVLVSAGILIMQWKSLKAKSSILEARESINAEDYQDAGRSFQSALISAPYEKGVYLELGKSYLLAGMPEICIRTLKKAIPFISDTFLSCNLAQAYEQLGDYRQGEHYYLSSISMMPNRMYPRYLLFKMYLASGQCDKAKQIGEFIMHMPVKVVSTATDEMKTEVSNQLKSKL